MPRDKLIQPRQGTAAAWTTANPVLEDGEPGRETDTGFWKSGDGVTAWADLPYQPTPEDVAGLLADVADKVDGADLDTLVGTDIQTPGSETEAGLLAVDADAASALRVQQDTRHLAAFVPQNGNATSLFTINDGGGRAVTNKVSVDPSGGTGNDQLAVWQIFQTGKGRLFHFTNNGDSLPTSGVRDFIGMGLSGGNGLLVSVKGEGANPSIAKGINASLNADAIAGSNALFVGQYNAVSPAASFQSLVAVHKPVLEIIGVEAAAGQKLFQVQTVQSGVYTTTEYIDSQTGIHIFNTVPDFVGGAKFRNPIDTTLQTTDQPRLRMKEIAGQAQNFLEAVNAAGNAYLFSVTAAGRILGQRVAINTGGTTGGGGLSVNGEGGSFANAIFRAHATTPGDLAQFTDSASTIYSRVNKAGFFMTRKTAAPADGDLAAGEMSLWFDSTNGAAKLMVKAKQADGTVRTGSVALA